MDQSFVQEIFDLNSKIGDDLFNRLEFLCENCEESHFESEINKSFDKAQKKFFEETACVLVDSSDSDTIIHVTDDDEDDAMTPTVECEEACFGDGKKLHETKKNMILQAMSINILMEEDDGYTGDDGKNSFF